MTGIELGQEVLWEDPDGKEAYPPRTAGYRCRVAMLDRRGGVARLRFPSGSLTIRWVPLADLRLAPQRGITRQPRLA